MLHLGPPLIVSLNTILIICETKGVKLTDHPPIVMRHPNYELSRAIPTEQS